MEKIFGYLLTAICSVVVGLVVYIWTRTIADYDKIIGEIKHDMSELKKDIEELRRQLSELQGEHNAMSCKTKRGKGK